MTDATTPVDSIADHTERWWYARRRWILAAIFVVAVVVRLVMLWATVGPEPALHDDMASYDKFARAIVSGEWWDRHVSFREPGYPLLVAAANCVGSLSPWP